MSPFAPRYSSWVHMIRHVHYGVTLLIDRDIELVKLECTGSGYDQ